MTQHVRAGYRRHRKATWAGVFVVLVAAALAAVVPALAQNTSNCGNYPNTTGCQAVPPKSTLQQITPSLVNVGGSNFSCGSAGQTYGGPPTPSGMRQFQISKPTVGDYTDPATGVTFHVTGPTGNQDPTSNFSFSVLGNAAVVYHVSVKGGTNTTWYDYFNNQPKQPAFGNTGVFSDSDLHSTPDSKYTTNKPTFYVASITTFCYVPLPTQPFSCTTPFGNSGFGGTAGTVQYSAQVVPDGNNGCKNGNAVMYSYTSGSNSFYSALYPVSPTGQRYDVVEHIHWTGLNSGDDQHPLTMQYDDTAPYDGVDYANINNINGNSYDGWRDMKLCASDPRPDPINHPFDLGSGGAPGLPTATDGHGPSTSCMLESTFSAGTGSTSRTYDAWMYTTVDGGHQVH